MQLGPSGRFKPPEEAEVTCRRFECQRCGAVMLVAPAEVLPRMRYRAGAIVMALVHLADGQPSPSIRGKVSPQRVLGDEGRRSWRAPARWARMAASLWPAIRAGPATDPRRLALGVVRALASVAASPTGRLLDDAVSAVVDGHRC